MILLALDTSSDACSVALADDGQVSHRHVVEPRAHTHILIPMIEEVLAKGDVAIADLDAIVLGNGPGSFIGMRIGASVAQGIAYGAGLEIVAVSSLAALAAEVFAAGDASRVLVAQDARMHEVYLQGFERGDGDLPRPLADVVLHSAAEPLPEALAADAVAAGAGWARYPELFEAHRGALYATAPTALPDARFLVPLGRAALDAGGAIAPEDLTPAYVRMRVAAPPGER